MKIVPDNANLKHSLTDIGLEKLFADRERANEDLGAGAGR